jgi:osmoprotectant transport system permease protein
MGLTEAQILFRVELPLGLPLILAGVRIAAVFVIATATIAAVAGVGGGLGDIIVNPVTYGNAGILAAALCVAAIALATALVLAVAQQAASRRMAPRA